MKICTLTFHRANNYGAMLQTYALQQMMINLGYDTEVLDYRGQGIEKQYRNRRITEYKSLKKYLSDRYKSITRWKQTKRFDEFRSKLLLSSLYTSATIKDAENRYDRFIVGSDQVWNYDSSGRDEIYLLPFVKDKSKKWSYAASFGSECLKEQDVEVFKKRLSKFHTLSVRESSGQHLIREQLSLTCNMNIDPVFLLTKDEWHDRLLGEKRLYSNKFIFVYQLLKSERMIKFAEKLAEKENLDVIIISRSLYSGKSFHDMSKVAGPCEFLWYIENAEYVITNSFHGMSLSIVFNKEFFIDFCESANTKTRLDSIAGMLGIGDRWISNKIFTEIDFCKVNEKITKERQKSIEYLMEVSAVENKG